MEKMIKISMILLNGQLVSVMACNPKHLGILGILCFIAIVFWGVIGGLTVSEHSITYRDNLRFKEATISVTNFSLSNSTLTQPCDPLCVSGCVLCNTTCYNADMKSEYTAGDTSYYFTENKINCWTNLSAVEEYIEQKVGTTIGKLWYEKSNPKNIKHELPKEHYILWLALYVAILVALCVAAIVMIVVWMMSLRDD